MMPVAAADQHGTPVQELIIGGLLMALSFAMVNSIAMVIWGLRRVRVSGTPLASEG